MSLNFKSEIIMATEQKKITRSSLKLVLQLNPHCNSIKRVGNLTYLRGGTFGRQLGLDEVMRVKHSWLWKRRKRDLSQHTQPRGHGMSYTASGPCRVPTSQKVYIVLHLYKMSLLEEVGRRYTACFVLFLQFPVRL